MTTEHVSFFPVTVLGTSASTLFTVGAGKLLRGGAVKLTNATGGPISATLHVVPSAGSASAGNAIVFAKSIPANDFLEVLLPLMPAGSFLQGLAGAGASINASMTSGSYYQP